MKRVETMEDLLKAIDLIDWDELHIERLKYDYGNKLYLYWDDENDIVETDLFSQGSFPGNGDKSFAMFDCNLELDSDYYSGWATYDDETGGYKTNDGRLLSKIDMAIECIQYGDFSEFYGYWRQQIIDDFLGY